MKVSVEIDEEKVRELVFDYLRDQLVNIPLKLDDVKLEVKSKQNYRSEWEAAAFRARVDKCG